MIKLSDRLQAIAALVKPGAVVADIGTDHGFLPLYLLETGVSPHVILSDVGAGPLEKAAENIRRHAPDRVPDLRLGDGLTVFSEGEVDTAVIAGMGGRLIAAILAADPAKTRSLRQLILQPRNAADLLRKWLREEGLVIEQEMLVRERRRYCEIFSTRTEGESARGQRDTNDGVRTPVAWPLAPEDPLALEISPLLLIRPDPLLSAWLDQKIRTEKTILMRIDTFGKKTDEALAALIRKRQERLRKLILLQDAASQSRTRIRQFGQVNLKEKVKEEEHVHSGNRTDSAD